MSLWLIQRRRPPLPPPPQQRPSAGRHSKEPNITWAVRLASLGNKQGKSARWAKGNNGRGHYA